MSVGVSLPSIVWIGGVATISHLWYLRCTFSQENFSVSRLILAPYPIRTIIANKARHIQSVIRPFSCRFENLFKSEGSQIGAILVIVLAIIVIKGPDTSQPGIVGNIVRHYIEETSASVVPTGTNLQLADISSLMGNNVPVIQQDQGGSGINTPPSIYTIQDKDSAIQAIDSVSTDYLDSFKADQIVKYTVQSGDTIGSIAVDFGVSINSIIWANNLKNPDVLSLDDILKIPPVTGVIHTVKSGDTIASIASKYKADPSKIRSFNDLSDNQTLQVGYEMMVPEGQMPGPKPVVKSLAKGSGGSGIYVPIGNGQCVAFVQAHGFPNLSGNANQWKKYINTHAPVAGGVVVLRSGPYGHVALITAVKESSIQVVEQNYYGHYIIDHREISLGDDSIVGFIQ